MVGCSWYSFGLLLLRCGCEVNHGREHVVGQAKVVEHHCGGGLILCRYNYPMSPCSSRLHVCGTVCMYQASHQHVYQSTPFRNYQTNARVVQ